MKIEKVLVTPQLAKELLERNTNNRNLNESKVYLYAREMKNKNWMQDTGEMIKISEDGRILDGQHRLHAIIKANVMINLHIASNLKDDVFKVIDTGKSRSAGDVMKIAGVKNANQLASIIQYYNNVYQNNSDADKPSNSSTLRPQEILEIYNERPEYWRNLVKLTLINYKKFQKILTTTDIGLFIAVLDHVNIDKGREFVRQVCEGTDVSNDVIILLRNKLISDKMNTNKRMKPSYKRALIIKTWNKYYLNKTTKILKYENEREEYPKIEGLF